MLGETCAYLVPIGRTCRTCENEARQSLQCGHLCLDCFSMFFILFIASICPRDEKTYPCLRGIAAAEGWAEPKKHWRVSRSDFFWYKRVLSLPLMYSMRADTKLIQIYPNYIKLSMRESYEHAQDTLRTHDAAQHAKVKGKWTEHFVDLDGCRLSIVLRTGGVSNCQLN